MNKEGDPILTRKIDLENNPHGTELKVMQQKEREKHGRYVAIPGDKTRTRIFVRNGEDPEKKNCILPRENKQQTSKMELRMITYKL